MTARFFADTNIPVYTLDATDQKRGQALSQLSHWDSLIVAAALAAGCDTLYSEDMQDGQVFEGRLTLKNPFVGFATTGANST